MGTRARLKHSRSSPDLAGLRGSTQGLPPQLSNRVLLRDENGSPSPGHLAAWTGSLRLYGGAGRLKVRGAGDTFPAAPLRSPSPSGGQERFEVMLPRSLLGSCSPQALRENTSNVRSMRRLDKATGANEEAQASRTLKREWLQRLDQMNRMEPHASEEEYAREADQVVARAMKLRLHHAAFDPERVAEAVRRRLLADGAMAAALNGGHGASGGAGSPGGSTGCTTPKRSQRLSAEELRERLEQYKYTRRIEPELPPLERPAPSTDPPPEQGKVLFNSTSQALVRCRPDARLETIAYNAEQRAARHRTVMGQRAERRATKVATKRANAEQAMTMRGKVARAASVGSMPKLAVEEG